MTTPSERGEQQQQDERRAGIAAMLDEYEDASVASRRTRSSMFAPTPDERAAQERTAAARATLDRALASLQDRTRAVERLAAFGAKVMEAHRDELGDIDGGSLQGWGIETGVLTEREATEACGPACRCLEWSCEFPAPCIQYADDVFALIKAAALVAVEPPHVV